MVSKNGIDYFETEEAPVTSIHHGVIGQHCILEEAFDEFCFDHESPPDYENPLCPNCGGEVVPDDLGPYDFFCLRCNLGIREGDAYPKPALAFHYDEDGYLLTNCLGGDILVLRSDFYTLAQLHGPRMPGTGDLHTPDTNGVKTYCIGHDWFESGTAPYPVYRVKDDVQIIGMKILVTCEHCGGSGKRTVREGDPDNFPVDCWPCNGTGMREEVVEKEMVSVQTLETSKVQSKAA